MDALSDQQLLGDVAAHRSEAAFGELVRRHLPLVYSAALRLTQNSHAAEDVAQANNAGWLSPCDLQPYATTPEQKAALNSFLQSLSTVP